MNTTSKAEEWQRRYDLTGQNFGRLTVLKRVDPPDYVTYKSSTYWTCRCECGRELVVRRNGLTSGRTTSCGCYASEVKHRRKRFNTYFEHGDYTEIYDEQGRSFVVDSEDVARIIGYYWSVRKSKPNYVFAFCDNTKFSLHRFLLNAGDEDIVDHINHDETDNRKSNLRLCNTQENTRNKSLPTNNKSGIIGVCQETNGNWRSYITIDDKNYKLYSGADREEAIRRRLYAENVYFGTFSPQKHLFSQYRIEVIDDEQTKSVSDGVAMDRRPEDPRLLFKAH